MSLKKLIERIENLPSCGRLGPTRDDYMISKKAVLALMDEAEQKPEKDPNRCAVCGWPLKEKTKDGCVRGNCSQRPLPKIWYDSERAGREGYGHDHNQIVEAEQKPAWEPRMWFEHQGPHECKGVADSGRLIQDERGYWHAAVLCRHVPPPKEVMSSEVPATLLTQSNRRERKVQAMRNDSAVTGAYRAVETSKKSHPDPRKWELCRHDVLKKDCPTCSVDDPFQGPHWNFVLGNTALPKEITSRYKGQEYHDYLRDQCLRNLRDELLRMRGGE